MRFHKERELLLDSEQLTERFAHRRIRLGIARPSYHWLAETENELQTLASSDLWRSPTLMIQAGQDSEVGATGQQRICDRLAETGCTLVRYEDAFHDLLEERDPIRRAVLGQIRAFFEGHSSLLADRAVQHLDS